MFTAVLRGICITLHCTGNKEESLSQIIFCSFYSRGSKTKILLLLELNLQMNEYIISIVHNSCYSNQGSYSSQPTQHIISECSLFHSLLWWTKVNTLNPQCNPAPPCSPHEPWCSCWFVTGGCLIWSTATAAKYYTKSEAESDHQ